jgi:hypothetical protein
VQPKHFRFSLAVLAMCSAFPFLAQTHEDHAGGRLERMTEHFGLVDVYDPVPLIPAFISFSDNAGAPEFASVQVDGLGYRLFYLSIGLFFGKRIGSTRPRRKSWIWIGAG